MYIFYARVRKKAHAGSPHAFGSVGRSNMSLVPRSRKSCFTLFSLRYASASARGSPADMVGGLQQPLRLFAAVEDVENQAATTTGATRAAKKTLPFGIF